MPIPLECECGRSMRVKDELAGKQGKCPSCGKLLRIPVPEPEAEDEAASYLLAEPEETPKKRHSFREGPAPEDEPPRRARREPERIDQAPQVARDVRKKKKSRPRSGGRSVEFEEGWFGSINGGVVGGLLMMLIAVVWFVAGIALINRIFIYPPILFVIGFISLVKGAVGGD